MSSKAYFCPSCEVVLLPDDVFCANCGTQQVKTNSRDIYRSIDKVTHSDRVLKNYDDYIKEKDEKRITMDEIRELATNTDKIEDVYSKVTERQALKENQARYMKEMGYEFKIPEFQDSKKSVEKAKTELTKYLKESNSIPYMTVDPSHKPEFIPVPFSSINLNSNVAKITNISDSDSDIYMTSITEGSPETYTNNISLNMDAFDLKPKKKSLLSQFVKTLTLAVMGTIMALVGYTVF